MKLSEEHIAEIECLRVIAMATNVGTKITITGFVRMIATRQLVMEGSLSGQPTECRYCRYHAVMHLRDFAMATIFGFSWAIINIGCVIGSSMILILGMGFRGPAI